MDGCVGGSGHRAVDGGRLRRQPRKPLGGTQQCVSTLFSRNAFCTGTACCAGGAYDQPAGRNNGSADGVAFDDALAAHTACCLRTHGDTVATIDNNDSIPTG